MEDMESQPMSDNQTKIGCTVFIIRNGKVLLGKRKNIYGAGDYGLPGGHLMYGEKLVDGARRELLEETGITDGTLRFSAVVDDPRLTEKEPQHYIHAAFTLEDSKQEPRLMEPDKCAGWEWFPLERIPENILIGHRPIFKTFFAKTTYLH